jgi:hypothetical protein
VSEHVIKKITLYENIFIIDSSFALSDDYIKAMNCLKARGQIRQKPYRSKFNGRAISSHCRAVFLEIIAHKQA